MCVICGLCGLFFPLHLGHDPINDGEGTDAGPGAVGQGDKMCIRDSILTAPPFFPISSECYSDAGDPGSTCGGIGPYTVVNWALNDRMRLRANADWPGEPKPAFENITVKFYPDPTAMRRSLVEFRSVDLAWTGLPYQDFVDLSAVDSDGTVSYTHLDVYKRQLSGYWDCHFPGSLVLLVLQIIWDSKI